MSQTHRLSEDGRKRWYSMKFRNALLSVLVLTGVVAGASSSAFAVNSQSGKVLAIVVWNQASSGTTWARVDLDQTRATAPACHAGTKNRYVFKVNTEAGKSQLSLLASARLAGLTVWIDGNGYCGTLGDGTNVNSVEELNTVVLQ